jgi:small GTP-binding protein
MIYVIAIPMSEAAVPHYKVVVLGNSGCGKTSLITRWTSDTFSPVSKPTIGSNHERKRVTLEGMGPIDLYVWDTAGQEQFYSLVPLYARSSSLAIVTAAIDDPPSFEAIPRWIEAVDSSCETRPPILLAVNKIDIPSQPPLTVDEIHRDYDGQFTGVYFVSALTGEGITQLFNSAAMEAVRFVSATVSSKGKQVQVPSATTNRTCC